MRHDVAVEIFWTIMVYVFVFGTAALGGFVAFYWLIVIPNREYAVRRTTVGRG
jgi:hypothetical protein